MAQVCFWELKGFIIWCWFLEIYCECYDLDMTRRVAGIIFCTFENDFMSLKKLLPNKSKFYGGLKH